MEETYQLVLWPDSQEYMEEEWFKEESFIVLATADDKCVDSAYFIPTHRIIQNKKK